MEGAMEGLSLRDGTRAELSNLPEELVKEMLTYFNDKGSWLTLATTNRSFKALMHHPRLLLAYATNYWCGLFDEESEAVAMKFYEIAVAQGSVEAMVVYGESLLRLEQEEAAEQSLRSALAQEGIYQDKLHFFLLDTPAKAFSRARYLLARVIARRGQEGESCPEAADLLRSIIESGPPSQEFALFTCSTYIDAIILLAEMTASGRTGAPASLQGALAIVETVAEPDGMCHCLMGRLHKFMMDESGVEAPTAHAHFVKALELEDHRAAMNLASLYKSDRGIPEAHRSYHLFIAHLCVVAAASHYRDPRAISFMEKLEEMEEDEPGHPQVALWGRVKAWALERMGQWMDIGPDGTGTMDLVGALAFFDTL